MMLARAAHRTLRGALAGLALGTLCLPAGAARPMSEVHDLKYGAILFEFYQQNYFEALVEYAWAEDKGGVQNHGTYPELLKGGISLSYGLDTQAEDIFTRVAQANLTEEVRNRAWFYLGKMQYLRGDTSVAARNLSNIQGPLPEAVDAEYRYLAALVNVKLGYFSAGEAVADSIDDDSPFAPYFYFNLAIAYGAQENSGRAIAALEKVIDLDDGSEELRRLADRARMALSFLYAGRDDQANAALQLSRISSTGAYSNRGLLGASWMAINEGAFRDALGPLDVLTTRSIALPEVQEAILLQPHVYEQMGLNGRAAQGFIDADHKFRDALDWLQKARQSLEHADVMELFVQNLDQVLGESDWFGAAPSVSVNHLSPFLVELMSDHSFQSVLKDLRDLYAIRNNLENWQARRDDFDVILAARAGSIDGESHRQGLSRLARQVSESRQRYQALAGRMDSLAPDAQERLKWQLEDLAFDITRSENMLEALSGAHTISGGGQFSQAVVRMMAQVDDQMVRTEGLITRLEDVMRTLVATELDIHEQRLQQYQVEAQLAKVRILDRSLKDLEVIEEDGQSPESAAAPAEQAEGGDHAI
ncbi:hypothetical protein QQF73_02845 [Marinobacter sp. M216]|uniref:Tetratricopeptide repeat protein n=1 Tax=Marinobacter albus TaxID=3030833 RepID=A0ABT7H9G4_9GAMM|nr:MULTISPECIES: hypothetical protein [unclassified Marinobacter]MBW7471174.1 hypothetical protein [Marinobacter sp. F4218]MDK9556550.1 hypothetical protein [Marinobacter sp. M216]